VNRRARLAEWASNIASSRFYGDKGGRRSGALPYFAKCSTWNIQSCVLKKREIKAVWRVYVCFEADLSDFRALRLLLFDFLLPLLLLARIVCRDAGLVGLLGMASRLELQPRSFVD